MVTWRCINCGSQVSGFEGEHGSYHGQCGICGFGYGSVKTDYRLMESWDMEQKRTAPPTDRIQVPGSYYVRVQGYDNGVPRGPFDRLESAIDWYYCCKDAVGECTIEREYEVLQHLNKDVHKEQLEVPELDAIVAKVAKEVASRE